MSTVRSCKIVKLLPFSQFVIQVHIALVTQQLPHGFAGRPVIFSRAAAKAVNDAPGCIDADIGQQQLIFQLFRQRIVELPAGQPVQLSDA